MRLIQIGKEPFDPVGPREDQEVFGGLHTNKFT
jgi:hypothetical protein